MQNPMPDTSLICGKGSGQVNDIAMSQRKQGDLFL